MKQQFYLKLVSRMHCENEEVQIALFLKRNMLQGKKLVQRFIFLFIFNLV